MCWRPTWLLHPSSSSVPPSTHFHALHGDANSHTDCECRRLSRGRTTSSGQCEAGWTVTHKQCHTTPMWGRLDSHTLAVSHNTDVRQAGQSHTSSVTQHTSQHSREWLTKLQYRLHTTCYAFPIRSVTSAHTLDDTFSWTLEQFYSIATPISGKNLSGNKNKVDD